MKKWPQQILVVYYAVQHHQSYGSLDCEVKVNKYHQWLIFCRKDDLWKNKIQSFVQEHPCSPDMLSTSKIKICLFQCQPMQQTKVQQRVSLLHYDIFNWGGHECRTQTSFYWTTLIKIVRHSSSCPSLNCSDFLRNFLNIVIQLKCCHTGRAV